LNDPEITIDLHEDNTRKPSKYNIFWKTTTQYLMSKAADSIIAVDEQCHDTVIHFAIAISANDLLVQIKNEYASETAIPSS
ncbi:11479_t:CDS:1, partial [Scutellospora calospora]